MERGWLRAGHTAEVKRERELRPATCTPARTARVTSGAESQRQRAAHGGAEGHSQLRPPLQAHR